MDDAKLCTYCGKPAFIGCGHAVATLFPGKHTHLLCYHERIDRSWSRFDEFGRTRHPSDAEIAAHKEWAARTYTKPV